jgi:hypothetical protein
VSKPLPFADIDTAPYWEAAREHRLIAQRCGDCGTLLFPPKPRCPACLTSELTWTDLSGTGTVYSFCVMHMSLIPGYEPPYVVAQIELDDQPGLRITTNVVDCAVDAVRIGLPVAVTFEERTPETTLPQFRPR